MSPDRQNIDGLKIASTDKADVKGGSNPPNDDVQKNEDEKPKTKDPPSIEMLHAHIAKHFPTFDLSTLSVPEEKVVKWEKGVTPLRTPMSYYPKRPPHSYSKGFTPTT